MKRHYYISDNLTDLKNLEDELQSRGLSSAQFHVLSDKDAEVEQHDLHDVQSLMKKDVVHSTERGALIGLLGAAIVLAGAYYAGFTAVVGWVPFVFLAIIVLGFCAWEGGLFGIQVPNNNFTRFRDALRSGKHVFFVDVESSQENMLAEIVSAHPTLEVAGMGTSTPRWLISFQQKWKQFIETMP